MPGQVEEHVSRIREELDREREERNYFQLERDKIHTFWEITRRQLEEKKAELRNKDREMEEAEERHQVEIKVSGVGLSVSTRVMVQQHRKEAGWGHFLFFFGNRLLCLCSLYCEQEAIFQKESKEVCKGDLAVSFVTTLITRVDSVD